MISINEYLLSKNKQYKPNSLQNLKKTLDNAIQYKQNNDEWHDVCLNIMNNHNEINELFEYLNDIINDDDSFNNVFINRENKPCDGTNKTNFSLFFTFKDKKIIVFEFWENLDIIGIKFTTFNGNAVFTIDFKKELLKEIPRSPNKPFQYKDFSTEITTESIEAIIKCIKTWIKH